MFVLLLLFVLVPIVEIYVIIQVGQAIGALWTVLLLIADSLIGARLLTWQGRTAWRSFQDALAAGRIPHNEVLDGVMIVIGGTLLLTPGFVTDLFGLFLLLPPSRVMLRRAVVRSIQRRGAVARVVVYGSRRATARPVPDKPGPDVEGESPAPPRRLPPGPDRQLPPA